MKLSKLALLTSTALASLVTNSALADASSVTLAEALTSGKASTSMNLRYESVDQDNAKKDADALTLRTRLNYTTGSYQNFSAAIEFEDSRVIAGVDDYNNTNGLNTDYSVIADPETTELDQAYIQYKNDKLTAKLGRQVITLDGHRFIGHVGWRQDRQTFDAASFTFAVNEKLTASYAYISKRNRIFGEEKDIDAKDHLLNLSYKTAIGKLAGYSYILEEDKSGAESMDTYGISLTGKKDQLSYAFEIATQSFGDYDAKYFKAEGGYNLGKVTAKIGYELLSSDDGIYSFSTPLATLHKFNGWSDQFLGTPKQGLTDLYASVSGKLAGGKWAVIYHDFSADESTSDIDDLGSEINAVYSKGFGKHYSAGIKFAAYSAGDDATGKVDTDKLWIWGSVKF